MGRSGEIEILLELLERMIREERRGQRFFADAASFLPPGDERRLFQHLSSEELSHLEVLQAEQGRLEAELKAERAAGGKAGKDPRVRTHYIEYEGEPMPVFEVSDPGEVEGLIAIDLPKLELFRASDFERLLQDCSLEEILKLGMRVEYDNFKYLVEVARSFRTREARQRVLKLAQDEKEHFLWLRHKYDRLQARRS